ncbi:hypothetical protein TRAPUB_1347 [Trametes pubescens]|uniref:Uncharacterized protein n=1 Tax=Trametes pubescens TaxID=154538 RepID=A0A1M2VJH7_TRAPU|nr:hypothetical protein TRAPUB_1347 [Trametes pubescens]
MPSQFCKVWTIVQSYVTIFSYISIHGTPLCSLRKSYFSRSCARCLPLSAIVAWRLYAILRGKAWVAWTLWIAGFLNFAISAGITTASLIPTIGASANHIPASAPNLTSAQPIFVLFTTRAS